MWNSFTAHATWNTTTLWCVERRNRTLLDMVQSMMSLTNLPLSFWGYALETTTFTLKGHHLNPLRRHRMNYGLVVNLSCRFLKLGVAMLI